MEHDWSVQTSRELRQIITRQVQSFIQEPHSYKTAVIAALAIRATRLNEAVLILTSSSLREEAHALLRILIEVAVNGSYLLVANEKEFNAFVAHPVVALNKHHRAYLNHCNNETTFTEDFNQLLTETASEAETVSGRTPKDSSWTSESVYKRAVAADADLKHGLLPDLAATAYIDGHDYVHGNFPSLIETMEALAGKKPSTEEMRSDKNLMLSAATMALLGYALAIEAYFKTGCKGALQQIVIASAEQKADHA